MKGIGRRGIKKGFVLEAVFLFFLVFLTGCGMKGDEGRKGAVTLPAEGWKKEKEKEVFDVLPIVAVDEEYVWEEGEFSFGELHIAVPQELWEKTQVGAVTLSDGSRGACMWSEEYSCPVEILFYHYKAAWQQEPMHMHGLAYALMELIGTDSIRCRNVNRYTSQSELSFFAEDDLWRYYVLVCGEDIYLVKDMDTFIHFGFRSFYYDDFVTWGEAGWAVTINGGASVGYARGKEPDGNAFFLIQKKDGITVYKNSMEKIDHTLWIGEDKSPDVAFEKDVNFDGYPDLCGYRDYYLYHPESERFEKVETDTEVAFLSYNTYFFEEGKTIWRSESEYDKESWHRSAYKEQLWQWEGYEPVLVRECVAEFGEKDVTICAREVQTGKALFTAIIPNEEYSGNSAELKALYEQFYAGYVPGEVYYLNHRAAGDVTYIPDGLIDLLSEAMLDGTEPETLEAMVIDRELSDEELWVTASVNRGIGSVIMAIAPGWHGDVVAVSGDGDNDGIEDILAEIYGGGSGGFTEFAFFKGQPDGTFMYTGSYSHVMEEFALICYEGKNYLCRTTYDYNKKMYDGLDLFYYEDGRRKESVYLYFVPETYQVQVKSYASEAYRDCAEAYFTAEDCMEASDRINQGEAFLGSAETKGEDGYSCDLDNDGEEESYSRYIWYPSNRLEYGLIFQCEDVPMADEAIYKSGQDGFPVIFWVEEADGENIMNVLYQMTGLYDFHIAGFVIGKEDYKQVYDIECLAKCTVVADRHFIYEGEE